MLPIAGGIILAFIVKSGVQAYESSGGLIDRCDLDPIFKFNSSNDLGEVVESA